MMMNQHIHNSRPAATISSSNLQQQHQQQPYHTTNNSYGAMYHPLMAVAAAQQQQQQQQQQVLLAMNPFPLPQQQQPPIARNAAGQPDLEELRKRARLHVNEAIRLTPLPQKRAYLQALERAPQIVAEESDPLMFVRVCDYDVWKAAQRLCCYWTERLELFGEDRAFRPMTITGEGALSKDDVLTLQAGFPAMLPRSKTGRLAVYCDRRQWIASATVQSKLRCTFYIVQKLSEDERAQTEGVLVFILLVMPKVIEFDQTFVKKVWQSLETFYPAKAQMHCLCYLPKTEKHAYLVQELIAQYVNNLMERNCDVEVHIEREKGEILEALEEMGLAREGIPTTVGGNWHFVEALNWCRARILEEREQMRKQASASILPERNVASSDSATAVTNTEEAPLDQEALLAKRRATNAIHSRRKRERRKHELQTLKDEKERLAKENESLKAQFAKLDALLTEAEGMVADLPVAPIAVPVSELHAGPAMRETSSQSLNNNTSNLKGTRPTDQPGGEPSSGNANREAELAQLAASVLNKSPEERQLILDIIMRKQQSSSS